MVRRREGEGGEAVVEGSTREEREEREMGRRAVRLAGGLGQEGRVRGLSERRWRE